MNVNCSLNSLIPYYDQAYPFNWEQQFGRQAPLCVEIGFGLGEILTRLAQDFPQKNFIGIEQNWERLFKALKKITQINSDSNNSLQNIRILELDCRVALEWLFSSKTINEVYCLFPCPWPKKGQAKHRLFSQDFLKLLNNRLSDRGELKIVTDFQPFAEWVKEQIPQTGFHFSLREVKSQYNTKFEKKWRLRGQEDFYEMECIKYEHIDWSKKEEAELKAYRLKNFNPQKFQFLDQKDIVSVIFKDKLFDQEKEEMMIYLLVVEEHLIQHFWVSIAKDNDSWLLRRADGQNFFPTPGIVCALELVYKASLQSV